MTMRIIIDEATKEIVVAGNPYPNDCQLEPVLLLDGDYTLPPQILNDANYASVHELLGSMPQRDVQPEEYPEEGVRAAG